jgi:hypothetical protein
MVEWMKPDCSLCRVERLFGLKWGYGTHGAMEPIEKGQTPDEAAHVFGLKWGNGTHGAMEPIEKGQTPDEAALIERTDAG